MRIVIADDEMLLREGLARLLADEGFDVVGKATDAQELLRAVRLTAPAVAIALSAVATTVGRRKRATSPLTGQTVLW